MDNSDEDCRHENLRVVSAIGNPRFRYVSMSTWGLMAARHQGMELARGHVVTFIDDDSLVGEEWLRGVEQAFRDTGVVLATGPVLPEYEVPAPAWLDGLWEINENGRYLGHLSLLDFGTEPRWISPLFVWGCNYSIRKEIFLQVNGSHPDYLPPRWKGYQGDGEVGLSVKVGALGFQAYYSPACAIRHLVPATRLTLNYLGNRSFFVGLHQSFTAFRRERGLGPEYGVFLPQNARETQLGKVRSVMGKLKRDALLALDLGCRDEISQLKRHLQRRYRDGWRFHRTELKKDPRLAEYVLRPHYMGDNGSLPS